MESEVQNVLDMVNSAIRNWIIITICQTLVYGIYLCLVPIAVHAMITNGLQSRARKWLLAITTSMFALMTAYWIISVVLTFRQVDLWNNASTACYSSDNASFCVNRDTQRPQGILIGDWLVMIEDILLVNYIIADGVVVWRAWVLCSDQSGVVLMIPVVALGINTIVYLMTVTSRAIQLFSIPNREDPQISLVVHIAEITQVANMTFSVLINIFATSIIALKAWKYRKLLIESGIGIRTPRQAIRILAILVESGMIYILIGVTSVVSIFIFISLGTEEIPTLLGVVGIHLVGIYPILVILLVEKNRSLNSTYSSFGTIIDVREERPSQAEPMAFASGSVLASGGETDSVPKPPHTITHITFDHMMEPGGGGIDAGNSKVSIEEHAASY